MYPRPTTCSCERQPLLNTPPPPYSPLPHAYRHNQSPGRPTGPSYGPHTAICIHVQPTAVVLKVPPYRGSIKACSFLLKVFFLTFVLLGFGTYYFYMNPRYTTDPGWSTGPGHRNPNYPIPRNVELITCQEPLKGRRQNEVNLDTPVTSDTLLLFVNGPSLGGTVLIKTNPRSVGDVTFTVNLRTTHGYDANTLVCSIKRGDREYGVGVFNTHRERSSIFYDIVVELPENHPLINRFESAIVNGGYYLDELEDSILFDQLQLQSTNGGIHAQSLNTHTAQLTSTNGRISGKIKATNRLELTTTNEAIETTIDFNHDSNRAAVLSLTTTNGHITSDIRLHDFTPVTYMASGLFSVTTKTTNGPINLNFSEAPVDSELHLNARTTNAGVSVALHPTYQGHIAAGSSRWIGASVIVKENVDDPSGNGRRRHSDFSYNMGRVNGDVYWGDIKGKGRVEVESTNAKVTVLV